MDFADPTIDRDAWNLAQQIINSDPAIQVAHEAARAIGLTQQAAIDHLRQHLALSYAQGYVRGLRVGRERKVMPPPPIGRLRQ